MLEEKRKEQEVGKKKEIAKSSKTKSQTNVRRVQDLV